MKAAIRTLLVSIVPTVAAGPPKSGRGASEVARRYEVARRNPTQGHRQGASARFAMAGILHLTAPGPFLAITPDWVVWPQKVIRVTGLLEIPGATVL